MIKFIISLLLLTSIANADKLEQDSSKVETFVKTLATESCFVGTAVVAETKKLKFNAQELKEIEKLCNAYGKKVVK